MIEQGQISDIGLLLVWGIVFLLFGAYTKNAQLTTIGLGKAIGANNPENPTGLQDAITPRWQTRNNIILFVIAALFAIQCFVTLPWYYAIPVLLVSFFVGVPMVSRFAVPKPMSQKFVVKIKADLEKRREEYQAQNDNERMEATTYVLEKNKPI